MPSNNTIQRCVKQNTKNAMILTRDSVAANPTVFVPADKGNKNIIRAYPIFSTGTTKKKKS